MKKKITSHIQASVTGVPHDLHLPVSVSHLVNNISAPFREHVKESTAIFGLYRDVDQPW